MQRVDGTIFNARSQLLRKICANQDTSISLDSNSPFWEATGGHKAGNHTWATTLTMSILTILASHMGPTSLPIRM